MSENNVKLSELNSKLVECSKDLAYLESTFIEVAMQIVEMESIEREYEDIVTKLKLANNHKISSTFIKEEVGNIQKVIKETQEDILKIRKRKLSVKDADYKKVANKIILKTENVTKATRLLERFMRKYTTPKGLFKIATINRQQTENEINKQIYIKADNIVRILKIEKYETQRGDIVNEGIKFKDGLNKKAALQVERLKNIEYKMIVEQKKTPELKKEYSVEDALATLMACKKKYFYMDEVPKIDVYMERIVAAFDAKGVELSNDKIVELADEKVRNDSEYLMLLPIKFTKNFNSNGSQLDYIRNENACLEKQIEQLTKRYASRMLQINSQYSRNELIMIQMDLEEIENALLGLDTMYESKKVIEKAKDLIIPNKKKVLAKAN